MKPESPVIPGHNVEEVVFAKDQPEYLPLPAVRVEGDPQGAILTRWQPTEEERQRIADGQSVYLWVWTFGKPLQPLMLEVKTADEIMGRAAPKEEWPSEIGG